MNGVFNHDCDVLRFFIDWSQREKLFSFFACPLTGSFFYWLYAVGYQLFTSLGTRGTWRE